MSTIKLFLLLGIALGMCLLAGCGGTAAPLVSLNLSPSSPQNVKVNETLTINTSVQNYTGNTPLNITWTVTCGGGDCGTVVPNYTVVGQAVVYTAPATVPPATVILTADLMYGHTTPAPTLAITVQP